VPRNFLRAEARISGGSVPTILILDDIQQQYGQPKAIGIWARCYLPRAGPCKGKQEIANFFAQVEQTLEDRDRLRT
jgi:hypothetical protein